MSDLTSIAARNYSALRDYTAAKPTDSVALQPLKDFAETLKQGEAAAKSAMISDVDPHAYVKALAQTELAVEAAVTVRDKVVEAYQEILRMPV